MLRFLFTFRNQRKDRIFTGRWFGKKKPYIRTFLTPFAKELKEFGDSGKHLFRLISEQVHFFTFL